MIVIYIMKLISVNTKYRKSIECAQIVNNLNIKWIVERLQV